MGKLIVLIAHMVDITIDCYDNSAFTIIILHLSLSTIS